MRRIGFWVGLFLLVSVLTACAGGGGSAKPREAPSASPAPAQGQAPSGGPATGAAPDSAATGPVSAPIPQANDRKIILNAEVHLRVKDVDEAISQLGTAVRSAGGYVQDSKQQGTRQQGRTVSMVMRVPSGSYNNIIVMLRGMGEVQTQREFAQDVTAEFLDIEARIKTKEVHLAQLQKLYERGGSIKEMMELEQEIARVTADLESIKGRYKVLSNQVEFSTITASLYEPGAPAPIQEPKNVWERIKTGFTGSVRALVNFTGDLVVAIATLIPALVYLAFLGGLAYAAYRAIQHFKRRPPAA